MTENSILDLLKQGKSIKEISRELSISNDKVRQVFLLNYGTIHPLPSLPIYDWDKEFSNDTIINPRSSEIDVVIYPEYEHEMEIFRLLQQKIPDYEISAELNVLLDTVSKVGDKYFINYIPSLPIRHKEEIIKELRQAAKIIKEHYKYRSLTDEQVLVVLLLLQQHYKCSDISRQIGMHISFICKIKNVYDKYCSKEEAQIQSPS